MSEKIELSVEIQDYDERLDVYLSNLLDGFSRSRIQKLIKEDAVKINSSSVKASYKLKEGDGISIIIPEASELELEAQDISLDVRYEDDDMLVVNKPSGMLTHPTSIEKKDTLVNAILHYCRGGLSGINGVMRPGILHRLDRDTSGLLMIAKNDFAHNFLAEQIKLKTAQRQYLAVTCGVIHSDIGTIDKPVGRHLTHRHKMGVVEGGKHAVTHFKVLERFEKFTLVELTLQTGRTHQIRVHLSNMHYPIAGDDIYGGGKININLNGQALQAYRLSFNIPSSNERKTIEIEPDDKIKKLMKILGGQKND